MEKITIDKINKLEKVEKVEIIWIDAHSYMDKIYLDEVKNLELEYVKSCGYLIHQDKEKIILGYMLFDDKDVGDILIQRYQIIPMGMVKKIIKLKEYK